MHITMLTVASENWPWICVGSIWVWEWRGAMDGVNSRGYEGEGRPVGRGFGEGSGRGSEKDMGKALPVQWVIIGTTGRKALSQLNEHRSYLSGTPSLPRATQKAGSPAWRGSLAFPPWATSLHTEPNNQGSPSPFKNIINILSRVGCAHYLQIDASCLVSSQAGFGIICPTMLWVPFSFN